MGILRSIAQGARESRASGSPWVDAWLSGETWTPPSSSGQRVNQDTALGYPAVWRAVSLVSNSVAKVPLPVYRYEDDTGKKVEAPEHPAYRLLMYEPNQFQTAFYSKRDVMRDALLNGNGYWHVQRGQSGKPKELLPLQSHRIRPVQYRRPDDSRWSLIYIYTATNGEKWRIPYENMIHIRGMGNHLQGYSLVERAKECLGLGLAAQKYGAVYFRDSAAPNVVFHTQGDVPDEEKRAIIDAWEKRHAGADKAFRTAVVDKGMEVDSFPVSNDDAQFLETRQHGDMEVANLFNIPASKITSQDTESYNTLEQRNQEYRDDGIDPWLVGLESECRSKLLTVPQKDRRTHTIEARREALIQVDMQSKAEYKRVKRESGALTADEWRADDGQNPLPNGQGENILTPKNMILRDMDGNVLSEPEAEPSANALRAAQDTIEETLGRMCRRLAVNAERAQKKGDIEQFCESMEREHREVIEDALDAPLRTLNSMLGEPHDRDDVVDCLFAAAREALPDQTDNFCDRFPRDFSRKLLEGRDANAKSE